MRSHRMLENNSTPVPCLYTLTVAKPKKLVTPVTRLEDEALRSDWDGFALE